MSEVSNSPTRAVSNVPLRWHSAKCTHTGNVRKVNEDAVYANPNARIWAVADGMGGHEAGDFASRTIVEALAKVQPREDLAHMVDVVEDTLLDVNDVLHQYARMKFGGETVGSTVAVMMAQAALGVVLWAGDSRLYRLRKGQLEQITRDHNPISDLLDAGAVTEEEALNANTNIITRAIGGQGPLHLDIVVFDVLPSDRYLLCTDGLYRDLPDETLVRCLEQGIDYSVDALMSACLAGPAQDNVSLVVANPAGGELQ